LEKDAPFDNTTARAIIGPEMTVNLIGLQSQGGNLMAKRITGVEFGPPRRDTVERGHQMIRDVDIWREVTERFRFTASDGDLRMLAGCFSNQIQPYG